MALLHPNLVWMDLEMSGLDPDANVILEIATIVTDAHLNVLAEGPVLPVHQPDNILNSMDDWNTRHHTQSGLIERCRKSPYSVSDCAHLPKKNQMSFVAIPLRKTDVFYIAICQKFLIGFATAM